MASDILALKTRTVLVDQEFVADLTSSPPLSDHIFSRVVATQKTFRNVDFRYSIFDGCYFRKCTFDSCDFTGCKFSGTNFSESRFDGCKFDYASFERTMIDSAVLDTCCPPYENLKSRFARSLRVNFQQLGDARAVNQAILVELEATGTHLLKAWKSNEAYYRKKYKGLRRATSFLTWGWFRFLDFVWGNGESLLKLARSLLGIVLLIAAADLLACRDLASASSYLGALSDAPQVFLGTKTPCLPGLSLAAISFTRFVFLALFTSILIKRYSRR